MRSDRAACVMLMGGLHVVPNSRKRDLWLKVLTHDVMIIRRRARVETEPDIQV